VNENSAADVEKGMAEQQKAAEQKATEQKKPSAADAPKTIGTGWTTIVSAKLPKTDASSTDAQQVQGLVGMLPEVSGSWGKGHLFAGTLFSVLVTDDGRVFAGAVTPEKLYQAAA
jgi:hypothetical protein